MSKLSPRSRSKLLMMSGASIMAMLIANPALATTLAGVTGRPPVPTTGAPVNPVVVPGVTTPNQNTPVAAQPSKDFTAALAAIQAKLSTQAAARAAAAAAPSSVPDGLAPGGLVVDPRVVAGTDPNLWINASQPVQTSDANGVNVVIQQTAERAVMTWQQFNVGKNTTVKFDQKGNTNWTALNRIDSTGVPTEILGQIKADGQVLLINPNGILFRGTSQVNVHSLIASTMDIDSNSASSAYNGAYGSAYTPVTVGGVTQTVQNALGTVTVGGARNEDAANVFFIANGLYTNATFGTVGQANVTTGTNALFSSAKTPFVSTTPASVTIEAGALIDTSKNITKTGDGGYVALFAPVLDNAGTIKTQNGQIILAAGKYVSLNLPDPAATGGGAILSAAVDTFYNPNGNPIYPTLYMSPISHTTNSLNITNRRDGLLIASDGAVSILGDTIDLLGGIEVDTSVKRPGSLSVTSFGNVNFGSGSVLAMVPDELSSTIPGDTATAAYFASTIQPKITIQSANGSVRFSGLVDGDISQPGALVVAPAAKMSITTPYLNGTTYFGTGSIIDLAGLNVNLPLSNRYVTILVTANEVADTPLAKALIGQTVTIDSRLSGTRADGTQWVGSPLLNATGWVATIPKSIDELLTTGGSLTVTSRNVIQQSGAKVDISGGSLRYAGGYEATSKLLGADGKLYSIGSADPDMLYLGVYSGYTAAHPRWALNDSFTNFLVSLPSYESGYVTGSNAGSFTISANVPALQGVVRAEVVEGNRQRAGLEALAKGGTFSLNVTGGANAGPSFTDFVMESQSVGGADPLGLSTYQFGKDWTPTVANNLFPVFSDVLSSWAMDKISITGPFSMTMTADASLSVRAGGTVTLTNVAEIDGKITAHAGTISLTGFNYNGFGQGVVYYPKNTDLVLGSSAVLDVSGEWVNDTGLSADAMHGSAFINGGSVSISTNAASKYTSVAVQSGAVTVSGATVDLTSPPHKYNTIITADATLGILLNSGSIIDVTGGGYVNQAGQIKTTSNGLMAGKGGSVSLAIYNGGFIPKSYGGSGVVTSDVTLANGVVYKAGDSILLYTTNYGADSYAFYIDYSQQLTSAWSPDNGFRANIALNGTIYSGGFAGGGTFSASAPSILIDGKATQVGANAGILTLPASFFAANGFSNYNLSTQSTYQLAGTTSGGVSYDNFGHITDWLRGIQITAGTTLNVQQQNLVLTNPNLAPVTGTATRIFTQLATAPDYQRQAANLSLTDNSKYGLLLAAGATINTDPGASVSLTGAGSVIVLGSIKAPAGTINLTSTFVPSFNTANWGAIPAITNHWGSELWVDSTAVLDVSGVFIQTPDFSINPHVSGTILNAGSINLSAGITTVEAGAQFKLKGAAATIQVPSGARGIGYVAKDIWSNGGSLKLWGVSNYYINNLYFAGTVDASGGAPLATGGSLTVGPSTISSGNYNSVVIEHDGQIAAALLGYGITKDPTVTNAAYGTTMPLPNVLGAYIGTDTINNSGFDSATIMGNSIAFNGPVSINLPGSLTLNAGAFNLLPANSGLLPAGITKSDTNVSQSNPSLYTTPVTGGIPSIGGATVNLNASYVRIVGFDRSNNATGSSIGGSYVSPFAADGTLNVKAQWIDMQSAILINNASTVNFTSADAIRFLPNSYGTLFETTTGYSFTPYFGGALVSSGDMNFTAAELFPATQTQFLIQSVGLAGKPNTITFNQNGVAKAPLSAAGSLIVSALNIVQKGTLLAPLGNIVLGVTNASQIPTAITNVSGISTFKSTLNVTLAPGSVTSVSLAGLDVPMGYTIDQEKWFAGLNFASVVGNPVFAAGIQTGNDTNYNKTFILLPSKQVSLNGAAVATQTGAIIDASGGGDIYATEYVQGTGGSRNVLTTAAQGQSVYALVPVSNGKVAPTDPTFANMYGSTTSSIAAGSEVYLAGGNGVAAGYYLVMPGMYATLPGALRAVQMSSGYNVALGASSSVADGSTYVTGYTANALTGKQSSQTSVFKIQSAETWNQYSEIDITQGNAFFTALAAKNSTPVPLRPLDGGIISLGALTTLDLHGTNKLGGGTDTKLGSGNGGQVQISAQNMVVLASDLVLPTGTNYTGYIILDADQLSNLGASSLLLGGTGAFDNTGEVITANTQTLEIITDAAHALTGPELLFVTKTGGKGITVDEGSVITATGTVPGTSRDIVIGAVDANGNTTVSGDGSLLRVSNGGMVTITRKGLPTTPVGQIALGTVAGSTTLGTKAATLQGKSITVDSGADSRMSAAVVLKANAYDLSAKTINVGGGSSGLVLSPSVIANLAGAESVRLRSGTVFNLYDTNGLTLGDSTKAIGTLTLDGNGLYSSGGTTTINANNIILTNSQKTPNASGAVTGTGGKLIVNAMADKGGSLTLDAGSKTVRGVSSVALNSNGQIAFSGTGSLEGGAADITLTAPILLVNSSSVETINTTGAVTLARRDGTAPTVAATNIGGALTINARSIADTAVINALAGNVSFHTSSGDIVLGDGASILTKGSRIVLGNATQDVAGGAVTLLSDTGNVTLGTGSLVDVSSVGNGYAGTLGIQTGTTGVATLNGTLHGNAAFDDIGGTFLLQAGSVVGNLPIGGFTGQFTVGLQQGDIVIAKGTTLKATKVQLVANGGNIVVDGTIDASGPSGGLIQLYGAGKLSGSAVSGGVTISSTGQLLARYQTPDKNDPAYLNGTTTLAANGGKIQLGVTGYWDGVSLNSNGSELIRPNASGAITVASGAKIDVSGGAGGTGGTVDVRAPIVTDTGGLKNVNVSFYKGAADTITGVGGVTLSAYSVWSTNDPAGAAGTHFDGIIDPAGWCQADGSQIAGTTDQSIFTPTDPVNADHVAFYQTTLLGYVNDPFGGNDAAVKTNFGSGVQSLVHARPEIDLVNPDNTINDGSITVASNWNFGAANIDASGIHLLYRTSTGGEPGTLTLRAANNVLINATITDGFIALPATSGTVTPAAAAASQYASEIANNAALYASYGNLFQGGVLNYNTGGTNTPATASFFNLPGSAFSALQFSLQAPTVISGDAAVIAQYNQYYQQYLAMFHAYAKETVSMAATGKIKSVAAFTAAIKSGWKNPADIVMPQAPTLSTYYYDISGGLGSINFGAQNNGFATTTATDYVTNWITYFYNVANVNFSTNRYYYPLISWAGLSNYPVLTGIPGYVATQSASVAAIAVAPPSAPPAYTAVQSPPPDPTNSIANNPQGAVYNTTSAASLMNASLGGSFSYDFVGGAYFPRNGLASVNPNAVVAAPANLDAANPVASVVIDGHTSYINNITFGTADYNGYGNYIFVPTMVRTGTGDITLAAAGNVEFKDPTISGAVYTAGSAVDTPSDFTAAHFSDSYLAGSNGMLSKPTWGTGGGSVTVKAGRDIVGIEITTDTDLDGDGYGDQTGSWDPTNTSTANIWNQWYYHYGRSDGDATPFSISDTGDGGAQTAAYVNYASFFQQFGALGGGNITLTAGRDITDISASLPETMLVSGGLTASSPPVLHTYGGGNLVVDAGRDLNSGMFLVGRGSGTIDVGGNVQATGVNPITGQASLYVDPNYGTASPVPTYLAMQDGYIALQARGSVLIGAPYDPASAMPDARWVKTDNYGGDIQYLPLTVRESNHNFAWGSAFTSFGEQSGLSLASFSSDVTMQAGDSSGFITSQSTLLPASLKITALAGNIVQGNKAYSNPATLYLRPSATGNIQLAAGGSIFASLGMKDVNTQHYVSSNVGIAGYGNSVPLDFTNYISPLGIRMTVPSSALHANDSVSASYIAGGDITGALDVIKPADVYTGGTLSSFIFSAMNIHDSDVSSVIAGNMALGFVNAANSNYYASNFRIYGPGTLLIESMHDIIMDKPNENIPGKGSPGIRSVGNGRNSAAVGDSYYPYLPTEGADLYVLFGVGNGADYASAVSKYVDPANAGKGGIDYLSLIAADEGKSKDDAWSSFQTLSAREQDLAVDRAFLEFLAQVGQDYYKSDNPYAGQYARAYETIATLFPAGLGYTDNSNGGKGVQAQMVSTGRLKLPYHLIETMAGGDINLIGPGGNIIVGSNGRDTLKPNQEGLLTLAGGTIRTYSDGSVAIGQSRIMTQQGGDIDAFSANGDILAGSGPKTYVSSPPISLIWNADGYARVNPAGQVSGAGVAALLSLPGQDPSLSNVTLLAPHGAVDAGAAGIRSAGNLFIVAQVVRNAFNIEVGGKSFGVPAGPVTNLTLTEASSAATEAADIVQSMAPHTQSVISVEVTGFGDECIPTSDNPCKADK